MTALVLALALGIAAGRTTAAGERSTAAAPAKPHASSASKSSAAATAQEGLTELNVRVPFAGSATLYLPPRSSGNPARKPSRAILFLSGDGGWNLGVVEMARRAARESGAAVAGLSLPAYLKAANSERVPCWCPACDLEEIGKSIEKQAGFDAPSPPILLGYSSGATLVYAALAGGPPETFAGGMSLGFCPDLEGAPSICSHRGFRPEYDAAKKRIDFPPADLQRPWVVLQGNVDKVCGAEATGRFVHAVNGAKLEALDGVGHGYGNEKRWGPAFDNGVRLLMESAAAQPAIVAGRAGAAAGEEVADSGGVFADGDAEAGAPEESASPGRGDAGGGARGGKGAASNAEALRAGLEKLDLPLMLHLSDRPRAYLLFISGDGGWSSLDRTLAARLARDHVDTVGISALQYFWKEKPAPRTAADLKLVLDLLRPQGKPILFGGYSFGAEVAPFLVDRPEYGAGAADPVFSAVVIVSPGPFATWEVSPLDWFRHSEKPSPDKVRPQIEALKLPTLCVYGAEDRESACSGLTPGETRLVRALGGGHHFGGDYDVIADEVAAFVQKTLAGGVLTSGSAPASQPRHP
ncbi:MAG TPA: AcvB/VirJ family lysyl-phosphatidylglycerol hydrolase [Verrucomicrobiae bacterium]|nr:AcvB/VirJ family lysyl-phosphatidylglycerol hydrolase [Verrucomicrobiae bacterium]